jgi:hypothetical protein
MFFLRVVVFVVFLVGYFIHWTSNPDWGYRRAVEVGLIIVGIVFVYLIVKGAEEAFPQQDEPSDISPADRVKKTHEGSEDPPADAAN